MLKRGNLAAQAFFQVNLSQDEILYELVLRYAGLTGKETVLDLYCGTGLIALYLSAHAFKVYGIETSPAAVNDARDNALLNNIKNAEFYRGKAEYVLPGSVAKGIKPDVVVVGPPRKGYDPKFSSLSLRLLRVKCSMFHVALPHWTATCLFWQKKRLR